MSSVGTVNYAYKASGSAILGSDDFGGTSGEFPGHVGYGYGGAGHATADVRGGIHPNSPALVNLGINVFAEVVNGGWGYTAKTMAASASARVSARIVPDIGERIGDPVQVAIGTSYYTATGTGSLNVSAGGLSQPGSYVAKIGDTIDITGTADAFASGGEPTSHTSHFEIIIEASVSPLFVDDVDLAAVGLGWNTYRGDGITDPARGVDLDYAVRGDALQSPPDVAFYWADANGNRLGGPLPLDPSTTLAGGVAPHQVNEPARWGPAPADARFILAVLDPDNRIAETDETNNEVTLRVHDRSSILDSSVLAATGNGSASAIVGSFVPGRSHPEGPFTLSEAEVALGVDHFNWVQTIRVPSNMQLQIWRGATQHDPVSGRPLDGTFIAPPSPAYDPVPNGGGDEYYLRADGNSLGDVQYLQISYPNPDSSEPYIQEFPANWPTVGYGGGTLSAAEFLFYDEPSLPNSIFLLNNSFLTFTTRLVGIDADTGAWGYLDRPRTGFTWKSNSYHGSRVVGYLSGRPEGAEPILGGGIFDVRFDDESPVPGFPVEPLPIAAIPIPTGPTEPTPAPPVAPKAVTAVGGKPRRPAADALTVAFDGTASIGAGTFELARKQGRRKTPVRLAFTTSVVDGRTVVTLRSAGRRRPLADGNYILSIRGDRSVDGQGRAIDGDSNGVAGGDRIESFRIVRGRRK